MVDLLLIGSHNTYSGCKERDKIFLKTEYLLIPEDFTKQGRTPEIKSFSETSGN